MIVKNERRKIHRSFFSLLNYCFMENFFAFFDFQAVRKAGFIVRFVKIGDLFAVYRYAALLNKPFRFPFACGKFALNEQIGNGNFSVGKIFVR